MKNKFILVLMILFITLSIGIESNAADPVQSNIELAPAQEGEAAFSYSSLDDFYNRDIKKQIVQEEKESNKQAAIWGLITFSLLIAIVCMALDARRLGGL